MILFKVFFKSNFGKVNHLFGNISGIVKSVRRFKIKDLRDEFASTTSNFKDIFSLIKFQHVAECVEECLRGGVEGDVNR